MQQSGSEWKCVIASSTRGSGIESSRSCSKGEGSPHTENPTILRWFPLSFVRSVVCKSSTFPIFAISLSVFFVVLTVMINMPSDITPTTTSTTTAANSRSVYSSSRYAPLEPNGSYAVSKPTATAARNAMATSSLPQAANVLREPNKQFYSMSTTPSRVTVTSRNSAHFMNSALERSPDELSIFALMSPQRLMELPEGDLGGPAGVDSGLHRRDISDALVSSLNVNRAQACDGETVMLKCPQRTHIMVQRVFYGRLVPSSELCAPPQRDEQPGVPPWEQAQEDLSCHVESAFFRVSRRCRNGRKCKLKIDTKTFGQDPCPSTSKYFQVTYKCKPSQFTSEHVCKGATLNLDCGGSQRLALYSAKFGQNLQDGPVCDGIASSKLIDRDGCSAQVDVLSVLTNQCHGRRRCQMLVDPITFGPEPCEKSYLSLHYACVKKSVFSPEALNSIDLSDSKEAQLENRNRNSSSSYSNSVSYESFEPTGSDKFRGANSIEQYWKKVKSPGEQFSEKTLKKTGGNSDDVKSINKLKPPPASSTEDKDYDYDDETVDANTPDTEVPQGGDPGKSSTKSGLPQNPLNFPPQPDNNKNAIDDSQARQRLEISGIGDPAVADRKSPAPPLPASGGGGFGSAPEPRLLTPNPVSTTVNPMNDGRSSSAGFLKPVVPYFPAPSTAAPAFPAYVTCIPPHIPNAVGFVQNWVVTFDYIDNHREKLLLYFFLSCSVGLISLLCLCIAQICVGKCRSWPQRNAGYRQAKFTSNSDSFQPPTLLEESHVELGEVCADGLFTRWNHPTPPRGAGNHATLSHRPSPTPNPTGTLTSMNGGHTIHQYYS